MYIILNNIFGKIITASNVLRLVSPDMNSNCLYAFQQYANVTLCGKRVN